MIYILCIILLLNVIIAFRAFKDILAPPVLLGTGMLGAAFVAALHCGSQGQVRLTLGRDGEVRAVVWLHTYETHIWLHGRDDAADVVLLQAEEDYLQQSDDSAV